MLKFIAGFVVGWVVTLAALAPWPAHADPLGSGAADAPIGGFATDQGSYLAAAHADPVLAGSTDFWLMVAGSKACAGVYHENWGPAYAAVIRLAHQELCP